MKSNQEVIEMAGYKRSLLKTIRKRQLQIFWLINRTDGIEKQILSGNICGIKRRAGGRQRTKYTDSLINFVTRKESPNNELIRRPDNKGNWKAMIADISSRPVNCIICIKSIIQYNSVEENVVSHETNQNNSNENKIFIYNY